MNESIRSEAKTEIHQKRGIEDGYASMNNPQQLIKPSELPTRTKLPTCEKGVFENHFDGPAEVDCGMPAVASWDFGEGIPFYVCEEHDLEIGRSIEESEDNG